MKNIFTDKNRAYAYRVLLAVGVILAGYGVVTDDQLVMWVGLVGALLNVMPTANTSTKPAELTPQAGLAASAGQQGPIVAEGK